jgi:hypothetical protein
MNTTFKVRSLSPAYWYVCDVKRAKAEKCRAQIGPAYGTKAEAEAALQSR